jgi:predicted dehydrogenase
MVRVAVVGAGYWGINHVRSFAQLPTAQLVAVCDPRKEALARAHKLAPDAVKIESYEELLTRADVDAVVLATPAGLHAAQVQAALHAGKHVFVEKPMALSPADAEAMTKLAHEKKLVTMIGHLMLYHPGYAKLRDIVTAGDLGELLYMYAIRVNLGKLRHDENALWSFAPHDISMILDLMGREPVNVAARGECYLQKGIEDVVFVNLSFDAGADKPRPMAQIQLSWLDPRKERRLTVVGSKKMVVFDDEHPTEKLRIYDKGYDRPPEFTQYGEYLTLRQGDISIPRLNMAEPLEVECRHFIDCIANGKTPRTDATHGRAVIRVLDAAQRSLDQGGAPVSLV